jgi:hypothetical protein
MPDKISVVRIEGGHTAPVTFWSYANCQQIKVDETVDETRLRKHVRKTRLTLILSSKTCSQAEMRVSKI